jgi:hypothetical protein
MNMHMHTLMPQEVKEKKRWGRLQKAKGDWALLAGSPRDAFEHYKSAMELARAAGDAIWCACPRFAGNAAMAVAAAQEGMKRGRQTHARGGGAASLARVSSLCVCMH